ncbi:hypothetical protein [Pelotomaculum propionicicum]|uniref:hypothetical protein n=1 Tax=Pelotomaculum propionicicum TaxID=258475 RepID=UPI003BA1AFC2
MLKKKINGLDFLSSGQEVLIRFHTPIGIKEAKLTMTENIEKVGLPYRDRDRPIWHVEVNDKKVTFA